MIAPGGQPMFSWVPDAADLDHPTMTMLDCGVLTPVVGYHTQPGVVVGLDFNAALRKARTLVSSGSYSMPVTVLPGPAYERLRERWAFDRYLRDADMLGTSRAVAEALWDAFGQHLDPEVRARWALGALRAGIVLDLCVVPTGVSLRSFVFQIPHQAHGLLWCPTCTNKARKVGKR